MGEIGYFLVYLGVVVMVGVPVIVVVGLGWWALGGGHKDGHDRQAIERPFEG